MLCEAKIILELDGIQIIAHRPKPKKNYSFNQRAGARFLVEGVLSNSVGGLEWMKMMILLESLV